MNRFHVTRPAFSRLPDFNLKKGQEANSDQNAAQNEMRARFQMQLKWGMTQDIPPDLSPHHVANMCLEQIADRPQHVRVLLNSNEEVASAVEALLPSLQPQQAKQLTEALLDAGHIFEDEKDLRPEALQVIDDRMLLNEKYLLKQQLKYVMQLGKPESRTGKFYEPIEGKPHRSVNPKYSGKNLLGEIEHHGKKMACLEFAQSLDDRSAKYNRKAEREQIAITPNKKNNIKNMLEPYSARKKLELFSQNNLNWFSADRMRAIRSHEVINPDSQVQFSMDRFGLLVICMALQMDDGELRSFSAGYSAAPGDREGHELRVFIKKEGPLIKIKVYEPNLTLDFTRLGTTPENLQDLNFADFDSLDVCTEAGARVLCMDIEDPDLAAQLAGRFVAPSLPIQRLAFSNALACGDVAGMRAAASMIQHISNPFEHDSDWDALMGASVYRAMQDNHVDAIKVLRDVLKTSSLGLKNWKKVLLDPPNTSGLLRAVEGGNIEAIRVFGDILIGLKSRLSPEDLKDILLAKNSNGFTSFYVAFSNGDVDSIEALDSIMTECTNDSGNLDPKRSSIDAVSRNESSSPLELLAASNKVTPPRDTSILSAFEDGYVEINMVEDSGSDVDRMEPPNHHFDAVKDMILIPAETKLSNKGLLEIIQGKKDGTPGVNEAAKHGHTKAIIAWGKILNRSTLDKKDYSKAIQEKDSMGITCSHQALLSNQPAAFKALGEIQLRSQDRMNREDWLASFQMKNSSGQSQFPEALHSENKAMAAAAEHILAQLEPKLSPEEYEELMNLT